MIVLYGIKNCDTVKKARQWLDAQKIEYHFHDFRVDGLNTAQLERFALKTGWEPLLNKQSTSWRQLDEGRKLNLTQSSTFQLMLEFPTLIKRPVLDTGTEILLGFKADQYQAVL